MSGPKIDQATLEMMRLAELERQRQERLRQIKEATDVLNRQLASVRANIAFVERHLVKQISEMSEHPEMGQTIQKIQEIKQRYLVATDLLLHESVPTEPDDILRHSKSISDRGKELFEEYQEEITICEERLNSFSADLEALEQFSSFTSQKGTTTTKIADFSFRDLTLTVRESADIEESAKQEVDNMFHRIEDLINSDALSEKSENMLFKLAAGLYDAAFKGKSSVEAKITECSVVVDQMEIEVNDFESAYQEYYADYVAYYEIVNRTRPNALKIIPKQKYQFQSLEELYNEIQLLEQLSITANQHGYIREQIDEVMRLFHYNVTDEIVLRKVQAGAHYISRSENSKTGIHIMVSDNNSIMMEVVGVGESSTPAGEGITGVTVGVDSLSAQQQEELLTEQGHFCEMHPKIIEELKKRGITFTAKSRAPVGLQHCRAIYNTGEDSVYFDPNGVFNDDKHRNTFVEEKEKALKSKR